MGIRVTEKTVGRRVMTYLSTIPMSKFIRRVAGMGNNGEPDIVGSLMGLHVEIELKAPGAKPTDLQMKRLTEWELTGAIAFWADSVEGVRARLEPIVERMREAA